ncbi:hypothetical protein D3C86_1357300 [compost metagenome]
MRYPTPTSRAGANDRRGLAGAVRESGWPTGTRCATPWWSAGCVRPPNRSCARWAARQDDHDWARRWDRPGRSDRQARRAIRAFPPDRRRPALARPLRAGCRGWLAPQTNPPPVGASLLAMVCQPHWCRLTHHREQARSHRGQLMPAKSVVWRTVRGVRGYRRWCATVQC